MRKKEEKEEKETTAQRKRREREERLVQKQLEKEAMDNQIKINFGGRFVDSNEEKSGLKKYDHSEDDLEPLTKQSKLGRKKSGIDIPIEDEITKEEQIQPDVIENNLFKDVEEQKEDKRKAVLQLEHAITNIMNIHQLKY